MTTAGHPYSGKVILRHNQKTRAKKNIYTKAVNHRFVWVRLRQATLLVLKSIALIMKYPTHDVLTIGTERANCKHVTSVDKFYFFSSAAMSQKQILCHASNCFKL